TGGQPRPFTRCPLRRQDPRPHADDEVRLDGRSRRACRRGPRVTRETARGLRRHRHDRAVPAPFAGESTGRAVRRSGDLRLVSRGGREARFPARLRGSLRSIVVSSGGGAPAGEGRRANGEGRDPSLKNPAASRWRAPVAAVVSGVLFALAFPPLEWAILLPVA